MIECKFDQIAGLMNKNYSHMIDQYAWLNRTRLLKGKKELLACMVDQLMEIEEAYEMAKAIRTKCEKYRGSEEYGV